MNEEEAKNAFKTVNFYHSKLFCKKKKINLMQIQRKNKNKKTND